MRKSCNRTRFLPEPFQGLYISLVPLRQDLYGDFTAQSRVRRPIHLTHTAFANEGGDVVVAESGADFRRHGLSGPIAAIVDTSRVP